MLHTLKTILTTVLLLGVLHCHAQNPVTLSNRQIVFRNVNVIPGEIVDGPRSTVHGSKCFKVRTPPIILRK
jgi:hypothetical protein